MPDHESPVSTRFGQNPLEVARDAIIQAHFMLEDGHLTIARVMFRRRLEELVRAMCPECGRTDDHEDSEHRFVGVHQRELHSLGR